MTSIWLSVPLHHINRMEVHSFTCHMKNHLNHSQALRGSDFFTHSVLI